MTGKLLNKFFAYGLLFIFSPLILIILLCVVIDSPGGPPIIRIERTDSNGKKMYVYEFRKGRIINHPVITRQLTRIGKLINYLNIGQILIIYKVQTGE